MTTPNYKPSEMAMELATGILGDWDVSYAAQVMTASIIDAALACAREEARREALEEAKPMREFVAELTALDFGCISGDCPHESREECRVYMEGQMKQIASEARSYFPALAHPAQAQEEQA